MFLATASYSIFVIFHRNDTTEFLKILSLLVSESPEPSKSNISTSTCILQRKYETSRNKGVIFQAGVIIQGIQLIVFYPDNAVWSHPNVLPPQRRGTIISTAELIHNSTSSYILQRNKRVIFQAGIIIQEIQLIALPLSWQRGMVAPKCSSSPAMWHAHSHHRIAS